MRTPKKQGEDATARPQNRRRRQTQGRKGGHKATAQLGRGRHGKLNQLPRQIVKNPLAPIEFLSQEGIETIHLASLEILEDLGIEVLLDEACDIYRKAGAKVEGKMVYLDRGLVMDSVQKAPAQFTIHARNPENNLTIGGNHVTFCMMGSAPNVSDIEGGRRRGNEKDFIKLLKLCQSLNIIHTTAGYPVEPVDIPPAIRHLKAISSMVRYTDKSFNVYTLGPQRIHDGVEMARIARGISHEQLDQEPSTFCIVNTNSPLRLDRPMANGIIEMAKANQVTCITPFTLAGAMAPVTLGAALAEQNAEALAGIALAQIVRPGAPMIYGAFTSNVDMRSGAPAFGTPEYTKAALISGQLARRYNLPFRTSNTNASNWPDAQAIYESQMSIWGAVMGGGNLIKHATGWLEGGLTCNFEKIILDAEMLQSMSEFLKPISLDKASLGLSAMQEVGPGGHFFGAAHTMERYETAFYNPIVSDWRNFQTWQEDGATDATHRAHAIWKQLLKDYEAPPLDPAIAEELDAFVTRRIAEGGAQEM